jgi:hypothetical protein
MPELRDLTIVVPFNIDPDGFAVMGQEYCVCCPTNHQFQFQESK